MIEYSALTPEELRTIADYVEALEKAEESNHGAIMHLSGSLRVMSGAVEYGIIQSIDDFWAFVPKER